MTTNQLTGHDIYNSIMHGVQEIINLKDELDKINVFPVPDGDTGTNMTMTVNSIIKKATPHPDVNNVLEKISESAVEGARGNSGVILAQYFVHMAEEAKEFKTLKYNQFAKVCHTAYERTRASISKPQEGTIITIMKDWSESLEQYFSKDSDLSEGLTLAEQRATESLANTPSLLPVLKEYHVVDSGAKGFLALVKGISAFLRGEKEVLQRPSQTDLVWEPEEVHVDDLTEGRFCFELLLEKPNKSKSIKKALEEMGSSVLYVETQKYVKLHIHTDEPHEVINLAKEAGYTLKEQKVNDMKFQVDLHQHRKHKIALVTDSIADLPYDFKEHHQIQTINLRLTIGEEEYIDRVTVSPRNFYKLTDQSATFPKSSLPLASDVDNILSSLASHYDEILIITVAAKLSGTHDLIKRVVKDHDGYGAEIRVIDSKLNSGAQGLLVRKAATLIEEGLSLDEVEARIKKLREKTHIYVSVKDFSYMVRGGRVSPLKSKVANLLHMTPIITLDEEGAGKAFGAAFTQGQNIKKLKKLLMAAPNEEYCIVHGNDDKLALKFAEELTKATGKAPAFIEPVCPIVGISAGKSAIAIAMLRKE